MNIDINLKKEIFNSVYYPYLWDYTHRYEIYYGGGGSGKSHFIAQKLVCKALKYKRKILVIRKVMATQKDSCYRLFSDILSEFKIYEHCKVNKSDYEIKFPNESVILFKGMDNPEKIKSIVGISDVWIEEASEITVEDFTQLKIRLRASVPYLQMFLSYNPISKANWVYKYFHAPTAVIPSDTVVLKTTYKDNKFLPADYIKTLETMIQTNPTYYKIYTLGEFCSLDKLVFTNWESGNFDISELKQNPKLEFLCGLDFGFTNDPTALISSLLDEENKTIYVIDEFYQKGLTNDKIAAVIKNKGLAKSTIIADCAEQKSITEISRSGVYRIHESAKGNDSILSGIQKLQQYKIIVHTNCENVITELENYSWTKDKNTGEYTNKPIDTFNHCLDALRYSLQCTGFKPQFINKALLGL